MKLFKLHVFSPFQLWIEGQEITQFRTYKVRDLLIYLTVEANQAHLRDNLAALLWSDYPDRTARTNLRNTLALLRKLLAPVLQDDPNFLSSNRQTIQLNLKPHKHWNDAHRFDTLPTPYREHQHADGLLCDLCLENVSQCTAIYTGEFLSGLGQKDQALFEDWRLEQQEKYHRQMLNFCKVLAKHHLSLGEYDQAEEYARRQLALEPWLEQSHQQLMQILALSGQRSLALAQYKTCEHILDMELGVAPTEETLNLYEDILAEEVVSPAGPADTPPSWPRKAHNLPAVMTPFFGRTTELAELEALLLDPNYRLVTLVGSGGMGKTRLALATAQQLLPDFYDGVWFVPLAGISGKPSPKAPQSESTETAIVMAIAEALGLRFYHSDSPKAQLLAHLHDKTLLLVLDNLEHLLSEVQLIIDLLQQAPQISLLVTSRQQFNLQAEYVFELQGLPVPNIDDGAKLTQYSSAKLFIERAKRTRRGFQLGPDNEHALIQICRFLQGMPLGLELAASWIKMMDCAQIAATIAQDLDFLATTYADVPARHRSLRTVFEHSWQMLTETEQLVLSQASVFQGGFSQEAVISVTETSQQTLVNLVDKSLLQLVKPGYYQLHELLRQFLSQKLTELSQQPAQQGLLTLTHAEHTRYYLTFVQQREQALNDYQARFALQELKSELNNIRQAWGWAASHIEVSLLQPTLPALTTMYYALGLFAEGVEVCAQAIQPLEDLGQLAKKEHLHLLGQLFIEKTNFLTEQTKTEQAIEAIQIAYHLGHKLQSRPIMAASHLGWGRALWRQGKFELAQTHFEQGLALSQGQLPKLEADNLRGLANLFSYEGDYVQARIYLTRGLQLYRECNNYYEEAGQLITLGHVIMNLGDYPQAQAYYEKSLYIMRTMGDTQGEAINLEGFGCLYYRMGKYDLAVPKLESALAIYKDIGDQEGIGYSLTYLGNVWLGLGHIELARQSYQQALQIRQETGQHYLLPENYAGLAEIELREGNLLQAQAHVDEILNYLTNHSLKGEDLFRVFLTCYRVLDAHQDKRADEILAMAYQKLENQAVKITDKALQSSFLENVTLHKTIIELWQSRGST